ncbi:aminoglycoside phosphotransferase family protein [Kitasatospora sp. NPDC056731]|uniref:phosphotransferase family protein n=1 Tax=Kitasatospora sp. NPDC056731 TaxID=3155422 RepID=UPI003444257E
MTTTSSSHAVLLKACAAVGLSAEGAGLIRLGENALWRLRAGVVARVARSGQWPVAVREIAVARWLHENGMPVVRPVEELAEPIVCVDGHPVTFWYELPLHRPGTGVDMAPLLRRLHELPVPGHINLGVLDPLVRIAERIDEAVTLEPQQRDWLQGHLADLQAAWDEIPAEASHRVIHGDAWGGNTAVAKTTTYLLDFERTSVGPPEWDLATIATGFTSFGSVTAKQYDAICTAYGADVTTWPGYPLLRNLRELRVTCFALQLATADPTRHRAQAHYRLACIQGREGNRPWGWTAI